MTSERSEARLAAALAHTPGLDAPRLRGLVESVGTLAALADQSLRDLGLLGLSEATVRALRTPDQRVIDADLEAAERHGLALLTALDPLYPALLAQVPGAPPMLYVRGDAATLGAAQLAMVGSRHPTASGLDTARSFASWFARAGLVITSGLAHGIDAASHEGALAAGGRTVAVCGTGLDLVFPRDHAGLARRIATQGALVSEFPPGTPARRENFPQRNRIISGLALGTLVVEAARHSGSLITARSAAEQSREVFAIPGSIHSPLSRGCHQLIRQGAKLVEEAADVLAELKLPLLPQALASETSERATSAAKAPELDKDYKILLDAVGFEPTSIDVLVARTGLAGESVASMLLILELQGRVELHPGGRYGRRPDGPSQTTN